MRSDRSPKSLHTARRKRAYPILPNGFPCILRRVIFVATQSRRDFRDKSEQGAFVQCGRHADGKNGQDSERNADEKFGEISDLIGCLLWLADDKASGFVTGAVIPVDGGFSAYSGV